MKLNTHNTRHTPVIRKISRKVYVVTDATGVEYTADTNEINARVNGEIMAEFNPEQTFYLIPHTLN